jgi:predicted nucleic acid-binding protein
MRQSREAFLITAITELELTNALQLRIFRRELSAAEVRAALAAWEDDIAHGVFFPVPVAVAVHEKARELSRKHTATLGSGTLDILHVAAALVACANRFYTFDDRKQAELARAAGLSLRP